MEDLASLKLAVDSREVKRGSGALDDLTSSAGRADKKAGVLSKTFKKNSRDADRLTQSVRRLLGPLATFLGVRQIARAVDEYTTLNNRLKLVTDTTKEFLDAQADVFKLAQESRVPLQETSALYQAIARNQKELKLTSAGVVSVVDTINKSLTIGGGSAQGNAAAIIQLTQAFSSGVLRGQEFNSVMEQAPGIAKALAEGLGVPIGQLRTLANDGKISAEAVVGALLKQGNAVDEQFSKIQATISQGGTRISNSFIGLVGDIDTATGASSGFAESLISISDLMDSGVIADNFLETFSIWSETITLTIDSLQDLSDELDLLQQTGDESAKFIGNSFQELLPNIRSVVQIITVEVASFSDKVKAYYESAKKLREGFRKTGQASSGEDIRNGAKEQLKIINQLRNDSIDLILKERQAILDGAADARKIREDDRAQRLKDSKARKAEIEALRNSFSGANISVGGADDESSDKLLKAFKSFEQSLQRQATLTNDVTKLASVRYEVESGKLVGINQLQQERLESLATEIDLASELKDVIEKMGQASEEGLNLFTGNTIVDGAGQAVNALTNMNTQYEKQIKLLNESKKIREQILKTTDKGSANQLKKLKEITSAEKKLNKQSINVQLSGYRELTSAISGMYSESSKERERLHRLEMVFAAAEIAIGLQKAVVNAVTAITNQGSGDPYTAFFRVAAMAATMAAFISQAGGSFSGGGSSGGGSGGASTVLGAEAGTGSESIQNVNDILEEIHANEYKELRGIHSSMRELNTSIKAIASNIVRNFGDFNADQFGVDTGTTRLDTSRNKDVKDLAIPGLGELKSIINDFGTLKDFVKGGGVTSSKTKLKRSGLQFGDTNVGDLLGGGQVDIDAFADIETTIKKAFGLSKKKKNRTVLQDVDPQITNLISKAFVAIGSTIGEVAEGLGVDIQSELENYVISIGRIDLTNKTGDEINTIISEMLSNVGDAMTQDLLGAWVSKYQQIGEGLLETAVRLITEKAVVSDALSSTGHDISSNAIEISQALVGLSGGLDKFKDSYDQFFDSFFSDSEKLDRMSERLTSAFDELGVSVPQTREHFRSLVESVDVLTDAGQRQYAVLLELAPAMDEYLSALEDQKDNLTGATDSALESLRNAIAEQQKIINDSIQSVSRSVNELTSLSRNLESAIKITRLETDHFANARRKAAQREISEALSSARSGGGLPSGGSLNDAISALGRPDPKQFASFQDFARDTSKTRADLLALKELTDLQLTDSEMMLESLNAQNEALTAQLDFAQKQLDELRGIGGGVMSIADALVAFNSALQSETDLMDVTNNSAAPTLPVAVIPVSPPSQGSSNTPSPVGGPPSTNPASQDPYYGFDYTGLGGEGAYEQYEGFATGGNHRGGLRLVGENGPEVEDTNPSRIYSNRNSLDMLSNQELTEEVRHLRREIKAANFQIAKNTQKSSKLLDRWDQNGMPEERVIT